MKIQRKERKKFLVFLITILIISIIGLFNNSFAMKHYQEVDFSTGLVKVNTLNVRQGPGLIYKVISKVHKNEYIRIFAKIENWYVVQTENDIVGVVYADYIKPLYNKTKTTNVEIESQSNKEETQETSAQPEEIVIEEKNDEPDKVEKSVETNETSEKTHTSQLTKEEQEVFDAINEKREEAGLNALNIDDDLQNVCRIKAKEMVEKNYFAHNSPEYGTPFEMLKSNGIKYKVAGENIAGNSSSKSAIDAWMNSDNHKANIINRSYNYTGIAVVNSQKYGKIYVQMFIGR